MDRTTSADRLPSLYPSHIETMKERHDRAMREHGFDHLLVFGGAQRYIWLDDMTYPFKVNPHFKSWVPVVDNPNCVLRYTPGQKPQLIYWQPIDYWYKPAESPSGFWTEQFDIVVIPNAEDAEQHFPKSGRIAFFGEVESAPVGELNPEGLTHRLHFERSWKTDYELECLRLANERGARGHVATERAFHQGASEYELHLEFLRGADSAEDELPYPTIIALNEHASILHYHAHDRAQLDAQRRHSFLIDAGAQWNGYASDITRTWSANDDEFADLIAAVDKAQQAICNNVKPGADYPTDVHLFGHLKIAEVLHQFELVKLEPKQIVESRISSTFLPHGVGHFLGLQVHDVAGFAADATGKTIPKPEGHPYLRLTRKIEPRMVFTIEPGLYFIDSLLSELAKTDNAKHVNWPKVDAFRKFGGIRIEDDLAVTDSGYENLTRDAFARIA